MIRELRLLGPCPICQSQDTMATNVLSKKELMSHPISCGHCKSSFRSWKELVDERKNTTNELTPIYLRNEHYFAELVYPKLRQINHVKFISDCLLIATSQSYQLKFYPRDRTVAGYIKGQYILYLSDQGQNLGIYEQTRPTGKGFGKIRNITNFYFDLLSYLCNQELTLNNYDLSIGSILKAGSTKHDLDNVEIYLYSALLSKLKDSEVCKKIIRLSRELN